MPFSHSIIEMPIPKNKSELVLAIKTSYSKLEKDLEDIPIRLTTNADLEGHAKGTTMSINNLLAYLIGWGELVLKWHRKKEKSKEVVFPEEGFKWNELGLLAQKFYKDHENDDFKLLQRKLDDTVKKILKVIEETSNEDLYEKEWYKKYSFGRMIQLNTSSPYKNARARVRKWKRKLDVSRTDWN